MANNPSTLPGYNGQVAAPDANYPFGSARDDVAPGDLTGTPRISQEINDIMGFQQAILDEAGIVPSGAPDTVVDSQYLKAINFTKGKVVADYTALKALNIGKLLTGTKVFVTDKNRGGAFVWDTTDHTTDVTNDPLAGVTVAPNSDASGASGAYVRLVFNRKLDIAWFGAVLDGTTDDQPAWQAAVNLAVNFSFGGVEFGHGVSYVASSTIIPSPLQSPFNQQNGIEISGVARAYSRVTTDQDIDVFIHRERINAHSFTVDQAGTAGTGVAFRADGQTRLASFYDLNIWFFKYGFLQRFSIWMSYRDLYLSDNTCAIRLARADNMEDQTNPSAPGFWNQIPGWFHNQITFDDIFCNGGEVGIWASAMGVTYNNVTCQGQLTDGTTNSVLPVGQKGTGMWLEGGGAGSSDAFPSTIISYYNENTKRPLKVTNVRRLNIIGWFVQGVIGGGAMLEVDDSKVHISGQSGQDPGFTNRLLLTNNSVVVSDGELIASGASDSIEAGSIYNANGIWSEDGDIGKNNPFRDYFGRSGFFGTQSTDPAGSADDGTYIDGGLARFFISRNGPSFNINSRAVDGDIALFTRSSVKRGAIAVTNARGGATEYFTTDAVFWTSGTAAPEGSITAPVGSLFTHTAGGAGTTLFVKESGAGNTGWIAK